jgi:hypothetical protein
MITGSHDDDEDDLEELVLQQILNSRNSSAAEPTVAANGGGSAAAATVPPKSVTQPTATAVVPIHPDAERERSPVNPAAAMTVSQLSETLGELVGSPSDYYAEQRLEEILGKQKVNNGGAAGGASNGSGNGASQPPNVLSPVSNGDASPTGVDEMLDRILKGKQASAASSASTVAGADGNKPTVPPASSEPSSVPTSGTTAPPPSQPSVVRQAELEASPKANPPAPDVYRKLQLDPTPSPDQPKAASVQGSAGNPPLPAPSTGAEDDRDEDQIVEDALHNILADTSAPKATTRSSSEPSPAAKDVPSPAAPITQPPPAEHNRTSSKGKVASVTPAKAEDDEFDGDSFDNASLTDSALKRFSSPARGENDLSLVDEEDILQAVLTALDDKQSSVGSDFSQDGDVEAVLNHAQRLAFSGSNRVAGTSVIHTHEHIALQEEIQKAKQHAGHPTCCSIPRYPTAAGPHFAVGTNLGIALLFNKAHKLNGVCGSVGNLTDSKGAAVCISLSNDGGHLAVGHERGTLVIWNTANLQPLKEVASGDAAVLLVRFLHPDPYKLVTCNTDNKLKTLNVTKLMGSAVVVRSSEINHEFDSQVNDVDCIRREYVEGPEVKEQFYIACASQDGCKVFRTRFGISTDTELIHTEFPPVHSGRSNELVSWLDRHRLTLVISWTIQLDVLHVIPMPDGSVQCAKVAVVRLPTYANALVNLAGDCIMVTDQEDTMHIVDTKCAVMAESLKLYGVDPISFTSRSTGTRHNGSLCESNGHGYILGKNKVLSCNVLSWEARLDSLTTLKMWNEALELAKGFALEKAVATVGLSEDPENRVAEIRDRIEQLVMMLISDTLRKSRDHATVCALVQKLVSFCTEIRYTELFFDKIFKFLATQELHDVALISIEEQLLNKSVSTLPRDILKEFMKLFSDPKRLAAAEGRSGEGADLPSEEECKLRAENALMNVDGDPETLLWIANQNKLARLACVVASVRQNDPVGPIKLCLGAYDDVILEYLENTFNGRTMIQNTEVPYGLRRPWKRAIVAFLLEHVAALPTLLKHNVDKTLDALQTVLKDHSESSPWHDSTDLTRKMLFQKILGLLVDFNTPARQPWLLEKRGWPPYSSLLRVYDLYTTQVISGLVKIDVQEANDLVQRLTHHYVYIFPKATDARRREMQTQLCQLYHSPVCQGVDFNSIEEVLISKRLVRAATALCAIRNRFDDAIRLHLSPDSLEVDSTIRQDVFAFISAAAADAQRKRDTKSLDALRIGVKQHLEALVNVDAAALAQFVFEHLPQEDHQEVLTKLSGTSETYFLYMKEMMTGGSGEMLAQDIKVQTTYLSLLCIHRPQEVYPYLVEKENSEIKYEVNEVMELCKAKGITDAAIFLLEKTLQITEAMQLLMKTITSRAIDLRSTMMKQSRTKAEAIAEAKTQNVRQETSVFNYDVLSTTQGSVTLPPVTNSSITSEYDLMSTIRSQSGTTSSGAENKKQEDLAGADLPEDAMLMSMVNVGVEMCLRNRGKIHIDEFSQLWFQLLDRFAKPKRLLFERQHRSSELRMMADPDTLAAAVLPDGFDQSNELLVADEIEAHERNARSGKALGPIPCMPLLAKPLSAAGLIFTEDMQKVYGRYVSYILSQMVQCLDLPIVVGKIVKDNEREKFGPFKPIIVDILRLLSFKLESSRLTKLCTDHDAFKLASELRKSLTSGLQPTSDHCELCRKHLGEGGEDSFLKFFQCGHGYHDSCVSSFTECPKCSEDFEDGEEALNTSNLKSPLAGSSTPAAKKGAAESARARGESRDIKEIAFRYQKLRRKLPPLDFKALLSSVTQGKQTKMSEKENLAALRQKVSTHTLLLAPPLPDPEFTAELEELTPGGNLSHPDHFDALTTDEIIELFGEQGQYIAPEVPLAVQKAKERKRAQIASKKPASDSEGLDDDDDDAELDW